MNSSRRPLLALASMLAAIYPIALSASPTVEGESSCKKLAALLNAPVL